MKMSSAQNPKVNHLLEGSVLKSILKISVPVIFANILQTIYQLIDTFWVGRLGADAVAAVSLSFPLLFFLISFAMGLAISGSILIAQYNGRGDRENVNLIAGQTFSLVVLIAIVLSIIGYFSSEFLLSFLTDDPLVLSQAVAYLKISFIGIPAMFIYNIFQSALRGVGEVKMPMIIILVTVILNVFLDPLFMFGWKFIPPLGVAGVAWATLVTLCISAVAGIYILIKGTYGVKLIASDLKLKKNVIKRLLKLGAPSSIEFSSRSFGMLLMTFLVSTFGTLVIASFGIGTRILSFIIIPGIGLSIATAALVGNNLGARQHSRAEEISITGMKIGFFSLASIGILLFVFAKQVSAFFVPSEPELIAMSSLFIRIMALTFGFIGIHMVVFGTLKAAGKTTLSMFLAIFQIILLFGIGFVLSVLFGLKELGIWIAYPASNTLMLGVALYFYFRKDWLKKELV